jgi:alcohol dehydrogenase
VLVSCITSCGRCRFCREGHYGLCTGGGGWIFGHLIDGLQAKFARVQFADTSVHNVPESLTDEQVPHGHLPTARGRHRTEGRPR